ncbi:MAG: UDP-N-acetyl-2-amino-2-deoxyglucuronate dehydrogenase [Flavobacteriales bacterium]|jgi:UDP-N-acetyl-2-amino-2-deoxyglucuronate dehydrogenase
MANFALLGAAGYVAPKHMAAIRDTGNTLVAATDPHDSVGILDRFFPHARFFTEIERFDRHLEKLRRRAEDERVHYVSVCTPNYLHDAHVRLALRIGADAICEKPLVISPWNLDQLAEIEAESSQRVNVVLQLRLHESIQALRKQLTDAPTGQKRLVDLTYITRRGAWYHRSWKGAQDKAGGLTMNIGIHFFDMLMWLFGDADKLAVHLDQPDKAAGVIELENATVRWFLSVDAEDLPDSCVKQGKHAYRSITIDGDEIEFTGGFDDLHTRVYERILAGNGHGIADARPAISLVHRIRSTETANTTIGAHPLVR